MDEDNPETSELVETMRPEYGEAEAIEAQNRFSKIITVMSTAHLFGLLACFGVWRQYPESGDIRNILMTSAMIFTIGLATTLWSYFMFRSSIDMSREAALLRQRADDDEGQLWIAREKQADAVERAKAGFKPLNFSGICFVASALLGISGLLSI